MQAGMSLFDEALVQKQFFNPVIFGVVKIYQSAFSRPYQQTPQKQHLYCLIENYYTYNT